MEWLTAIRGAVSYAEDHLTDNVSLDDVARAVHLSPFFLHLPLLPATGLLPPDRLGRGRVPSEPPAL